VTLEVEPRHAAVARENFARAGVAKQIDLHVGPALETLARFRTQNLVPFDLVFIDADKPNNLNYVRDALSLSRPGTLIVVDNVVRGGKVVAEQRDAAADGVRRMADWIAKEPRLRATVIQTVGSKGYDGFLLARVDARL
jgi:predicted O-methyltransferase YrrM